MKISKNQTLHLEQQYFEKNLIIIVLILLSIVSCSRQVSQNEQSKTKSTISTDAKYLIEKEGIQQQYYENGQLKSEGNYIGNLKEGLHKEWAENGVLLLEGFYANGKENGLMKWYHDKGHLAGSGNMVNGIREGAWKICDIEDNGFCIEAYFKYGKREGIWKINHDSARDKIWKEQTYKNDKMIFERCWDKNGKVIECKRQ